MSSRRAVFVDRDGVLIRDVDHLTDVSQIQILPGVPESLRLLRNGGWMIVLITNQSVVARGRVTEEQLREIHATLDGRLREGGASLDGVYYCPHHPDGVIAAYRVTCDCRKPKPGLLLRAARELGIDLRSSVMVGDAESDIEAGRSAGCRTVLIGGSAARGSVADYVVADLAGAVEWIGASTPA